MEESKQASKGTPAHETPIPAKNKASATGVLDVETQPEAFHKVRQAHEFAGAKPKVVARPQTAGANTQKMGIEQANMLRAMMHHQQPGPGRKKVTFDGLPQRPKTAATSTVYDEKRIKDKLKYLDNIFDKLETEIDKSVSEINIDFFTGKATSTKGENKKV